MKHVTLNCHTTSILRRIVKNTYKDMREMQLDSDVRRNAKKILLLREALRFNIFWGKVPKLRERKNMRLRFANRINMCPSGV